MNKITVTKLQMDAIKAIKNFWFYDLNILIKRNVDGYKWDFNNKRNEINSMTAEQIILAWHGYAEIEKEYVSFYEALKAFEKGEKIIVYHTSGKTSWFSKILDQTEREASPSFHEMINLKWSIEVGNPIREDDKNE